jgi:hypothetical protein
MKKLIALLCVVATFISCKNDEKKETETVNEELEVSIDESTVVGSFMYFADAAVFQTKSELFGVVENEKLQDLILQAETLKREASDEVAVVLKVKKSKKPENEEGWENRIEILEIIKVSKANPEDNKIIKLGKENQSL